MTTSAMRSTTDIGAIKTANLLVPKINDDFWRYVAFRRFSSHTLTVRSFKILNVCIGFENSQAGAREARKMHFCTLRQVFPHVH